MKSRIKIKTNITHENQGFLELFQRLNDITPTLYFLDVCTISNIKKELADESGEYKSPNARFLRSIDTEINGISYFPSLMERVSDQNNTPTVDDLKTEARRDLEALDLYFKKIKLVEHLDFIDHFIEEICGGHIEASASLYHEYLNKVNSMGIADTKSQKERLEFAKKIVDEANKLGVAQSHPVVISTVACIYGCISAKKVLKFKTNPSAFNSSNAIGDIMLMQRVGEFTYDIESLSKSCRFVRAKLVTDDHHLRLFYDYFFVQDFSREKIDDGSLKRFKITFEPEKVFPVLFNEVGSLKNTSCEEEYSNILRLLGASF
ncbi:hypothetical protein L3I75_004357 [Vibrio vulnificus]|nr:hypothetical protein [Vibrio vulnificus]EIU7865156.1 hypothetical protein [Vibrio vulnificus]EJE8581574.1 hypothetical protein [Vibrio vulnificus]